MYVDFVFFIYIADLSHLCVAWGMPLWPNCYSSCLDSGRTRI